MPTYCWFCHEEMVWTGDIEFEDVGIEGEGVVASLTCPCCNAAAQFYTELQQDEDITNISNQEFGTKFVNIIDKP